MWPRYACKVPVLRLLLEELLEPELALNWAAGMGRRHVGDRRPMVDGLDHVDHREPCDGDRGQRLHLDPGRALDARRCLDHDAGFVRCVEA